jgi:hypothetical protein
VAVFQSEHPTILATEILIKLESRAAKRRAIGAPPKVIFVIGQTEVDLFE